MPLARIFVELLPLRCPFSFSLLLLVLALPDVCELCFERPFSLAGAWCCLLLAAIFDFFSSHQLPPINIRLLNCQSLSLKYQIVNPISICANVSHLSVDALNESAHIDGLHHKFISIMRAECCRGLPYMAILGHIQWQRDSLY